MKTTIELPDELLVRAKKRAAELRRPLRAVFEAALRDALAKPTGKKARSPRIRWVTTPGGIPPDVDVSDREQMHDWIRRQS